MARGVSGVWRSLENTGRLFPAESTKKARRSGEDFGESLGLRFGGSDGAGKGEEKELLRGRKSFDKIFTRLDIIQWHRADSGEMLKKKSKRMNQEEKNRNGP